MVNIENYTSEQLNEFQNRLKLKRIGIYQLIASFEKQFPDKQDFINNGLVKVIIDIDQNLCNIDDKLKGTA